MSELWRIEMLGGMRAQRGKCLITRFRSQQTSALLAVLAFHSGRAWAREELIEMLWPGCDERAGRNRLSVALSSLRSQFETATEPVFLAERESIGLRRGAVATDVAAFQEHLRQASQLAKTDTTQTIQLLSEAVQLYRGVLLPSYEEEWIAPQRQRLEEDFFRAARHLIAFHRRAGELNRALQMARRAVAVDPTREEAQRELIRLLAATGQVEAARRQGQEVERILEAQLAAQPDATTRALLRELETKAQTVVRATRPGGASKVVNRPTPLTRFFGRENDLAQLNTWLHDESERLLTLTGAGGSGKTRLATEVARGLEIARATSHEETRTVEVVQSDATVYKAKSVHRSETVQPNVFTFSGGAWFVPLADVVDAAYLIEALHSALHLPPAPGIPPLEQIVEVLTGAPALLILDNFEQLVPDGVALVQSLLAQAPQLKILVTSRHRLNLAGEREHRVAPLPLPTPEALLPVPGPALAPVAKSLANDTCSTESPAVALFCDRACSAQPNFTLDNNRSAVYALVRRLDGIPLAIELAAAHVGLLTPAEMLAHLTEYEEILTSTHSDVTPRHRTLRAAIAWSYQLLTPELQAFFTRLSVFRGGWTLEEARAVCDEKGALNALSQLRDRSLVLAEEQGGTMRFRMLETLREYAAEQLALSEDGGASRQHADYFARLAEDSEPALLGSEQAAWLTQLDTGVDNLRAALSWSLKREPTLALRMSVKLSSYWECRGHLAEGISWLEAALRATSDATANTLLTPQGAAPDAAAAQGPLASDVLPSGLPVTAEFWRGRAHSEAGRLSWMQGDYTTARAHLEESITFFRSIQDDIGLAWALNSLGLVLARCGEVPEARSLHEQALAIARQHLYRELIADVLVGLANVAVVTGDMQLLRSIAPEKLALQRELGNERGVGFALLDLAIIAVQDGDLTCARTLSEEGLSIFRALSEPSGMGMALMSLGSVLRLVGDMLAARAAYHEAQEMMLKAGSRWELIGLLEQFAYLSIAEAQAERATRLLGAVESARAALHTPRPGLLEHEYTQQVAALRQTLDKNTFEAAWSQGHNFSVEQAFALALDTSAPAAIPIPPRKSRKSSKS